MLSDAPRVVHAAALPDHDLGLAPLPAEQVLEGSPSAGALPLWSDDAVEVGVWQHSPGVSSDIEVDEVFVVVSGRATVEVDGGPTLEVAVGDVVAYPAGTRTRWTVHETLRKVYVVRR